MEKRNFVEELRELGKTDAAIGELAVYMNDRLIKTNKTIFEYTPCIDGVRNDKLHLLPVIVKLIEDGFFDNPNL
jgi:hypothetical protein